MTKIKNDKKERSVSGVVVITHGPKKEEKVVTLDSEEHIKMVRQMNADMVYARERNRARASCRRGPKSTIYKGGKTL